MGEKLVLWIMIYYKQTIIILFCQTASPEDLVRVSHGRVSVHKNYFEYLNKLLLDFINERRRNQIYRLKIIYINYLYVIHTYMIIIIIS